MYDKILCPKHEEKTPSLVLYPNGGYCFGCGAFVPNSELGRIVEQDVLPKYVEDINETIPYIKSLPLKRIRGLMLPANNVAYFILWYQENYYKRRFFNTDGGSKYKNPSGVEQPLFVAKEKMDREHLIIVEGELNALSLAEAEFPAVTIVSPGAAGELAKDKYLSFYKNFGRILIVADKDQAGTLGAINLAAKLPRKLVHIKLMSKDANEILVEYGAKGLEKEFEKDTAGLGMPCGL